MRCDCWPYTSLSNGIAWDTLRFFHTSQFPTGRRFLLSPDKVVTHNEAYDTWHNPVWRPFAHRLATGTVRYHTVLGRRAAAWCHSGAGAGYRRTRTHNLGLAGWIRAITFHRSCSKDSKGEVILRLAVSPVILSWIWNYLHLWWQPGLGCGTQRTISVKTEMKQRGVCWC